MPIPVDCPNCLSRLFLQAELIGKSTRCPVCREIFIVAEAQPTPPPPTIAPPTRESSPQSSISQPRTDSAAPKYRTGSVSDFLPLLESTAAPQSDVPVIGPPEVPVVSPPQQSPQVPILQAEKYIPLDEPILPDPDQIELRGTTEIITDFEVIDEVPEESQASNVPGSSARPKAQDLTKTKGHAARSKVEPVPEQETPEKTVEPNVVFWSEASPAPAPREIAWSENLAPPPPSPSQTTPVDESELPEPEEIREEELQPDTVEVEPTRSRYKEIPDQELLPRPKKRGRLGVLILLFFVILGSGGFGGYLLYRQMIEAPDRLFEQARADYEKRNYGPALKLFEQLLQKHPDYSRKQEARFFSELCKLRLAVFSVTVASDPAPAHEKLQQFLTYLEDPGVQPLGQRFSPDIWDSVNKLAEDTFQKTQDVFNQDKPEDAEYWLAQVKGLEPVAQRFRPQEQGNERERTFREADQYQQKLTQAHQRLLFLARAREQLAEPDDEPISAVRKVAEEAGLKDDAVVLGLLQDAEKKIQGRWVYRRFDPPILKSPPPRESLTSLLFAPRVDTPDPNRPAPRAGPPTVFFALARGVLYALDENDGAVLWATRVGIDSELLPVRVPPSEINAELVLVVVNDGSRSSITARFAKTGEALWHQPLPAPVVGQPVVVGQRVYVPLRDMPRPSGETGRRDEKGVILEIEINDGTLLGKIALGRPLGAGAARKPGTGLLFFPAESRSLYVFDVERIGPDGQRQDPMLIGIVNTEHPAGTIRFAPVLANVEGDGSTSRYLILSQTDGLNAMKLRAFPFPPLDQPQIPKLSEEKVQNLSGWSWFPPFCDGEKLALVTDRGEFGLFGINQERNNDAPLFVIPPDAFRFGDDWRPARGQIVHADELGFWVLANGQLRHLRIGFDAIQGLRLVPREETLPLGEPLHAAQVNHRGDLVMVVSQPSDSATCRATAIDTRTGQIRWQRHLGVILQADPVRIADQLVLMDHDGGLYRIDPKDLDSKLDSEWLSRDRWMIAAPLQAIRGIARLAASSETSQVTVVAETEVNQAPYLTIRLYTPEQGIRDRSFPLPAKLAGNPVICGKMLVVPLANGQLYRHILGSEGGLDGGPTWRAPRSATNAQCYLASNANDELIASDGGRSVIRWKWPLDQDEFMNRGQVTLTDRIGAVPVIVKDADVSRLLLTDRRGNMTLWDLSRLGMNATPVRAWLAGEKTKILSGAMTRGPIVRSDAKGKPLIVCIVENRQLVCIDPARPEPRWLFPTSISTQGPTPFRDLSCFNDQFCWFDTRGWFHSIDRDTGIEQGVILELPPITVPSHTGFFLDAGRVLVPLTDGTVLISPIKPAQKVQLFEFPLGTWSMRIPILLPQRE